MFFSREETQGWKRWCIPDAINGCPHLALAGLLDVSCMKEIWSAIIPCQEGWEDRQTFIVYLARPNAGLKPNSFVSRTNRAQITNYSLLMWRYMSWAKAWHVAERSDALVSFWARGGRCRGWGAPSRLGRWCQTWRWFRGWHHHDKFDLIPFARNDPLWLIPLILCGAVSEQAGRVLPLQGAVSISPISDCTNAHWILKKCR